MPDKSTDNDLRGIVTAEFGEKTVKLKLTLDGIRRAEILSDSSWQKLIARSIEGNLRIDDMVAIWWAGQFGILGEECPSVAEVLDFVQDEGGLNINRVVRELMFLQAVGRKHTDEYLKDMEEQAAAEEEAKKKVAAARKKTTTK
jgi:hypothetical protein